MKVNQLSFPSMIYLFLFASLLGCAAQKSNQKLGNLTGVVLVYDGNCMPGPEAPPCKSEPAKARLLFTPESQKFDSSALIDSILTDSNGEFSIQLPEGSYSIFIQYDGEILCDYQECPDECYCHPVQIRSGESKKTNLKINLATW